MTREIHRRRLVRASSQTKDKGAVLDFEAWINAQNSRSHTEINGWQNNMAFVSTLVFTTRIQQATILPDADALTLAPSLRSD